MGCSTASGEIQWWLLKDLVLHLVGSEQAVLLRGEWGALICLDGPLDGMLGGDAMEEGQFSLRSVVRLVKGLQAGITLTNGEATRAGISSPSN